MCLWTDVRMTAENQHFTQNNIQKATGNQSEYVIYYINFNYSIEYKHYQLWVLTTYLGN